MIVIGRFHLALSEPADVPGGGRQAPHPGTVMLPRLALFSALFEKWNDWFLVTERSKVRSC
jgi:hypothetical protein